jgi:hypothetical protein
MGTSDSRNEHTVQTASGQHPATSPKKPYKKPTFRFESVFETMALACGKISPTQFQCHFNRKNS